MSSENKFSNRSRRWRWVGYLLVALSIASGYAFWKFQSTKNQLFGFQPPEMALAQYTSKDVIGDLGGMKVRIPRHYAEYVEYDDDPGFGEKRKESIPERNFESRLRSFGMNVRFPDMKGLETMELKEAHRNYRLKPKNPWIDISINAGSIYPSMGENANSGLAKKLWEKSEYWFANYERAPQMDTAGLEAYVVAGTDPRTGKPARESDSTDDIYIHKTTSHVGTYISCGKTSVPGGVATCHMHFGLEPKAKVRIDAGFSPTLLPKWHSVRNSVSELIYSFEVRSAAEK
jgi:hypothetical protein